jgi:hypothetical protein
VLLVLVVSIVLVVWSRTVRVCRSITSAMTRPVYTGALKVLSAAPVIGRGSVDMRCVSADMAPTSGPGGNSMEPTYRGPGVMHGALRSNPWRLVRPGHLVARAETSCRTLCVCLVQPRLALAGPSQIQSVRMLGPALVRAGQSCVPRLPYGYPGTLSSRLTL